MHTYHLMTMMDSTMQGRIRNKWVDEKAIALSTITMYTLNLGNFPGEFHTAFAQRSDGGEFESYTGTKLGCVEIRKINA